MQHGAVHGKQGLGRSSMPKKVAGARWCGTKTKLGSDDEDSEEDSDRGRHTSSSGDITRDSNGGCAGRAAEVQVARHAGRVCCSRTVLAT